MSEPNLVNVWIYPYMPNEWHCQTYEGITGIGRARDEAKATFDRDWNQRAPYHLIEGHPPRPKRRHVVHAGRQAARTRERSSEGTRSPLS